MEFERVRVKRKMREKGGIKVREGRQRGRERTRQKRRKKKTRKKNEQ